MPLHLPQTFNIWVRVSSGWAAIGYQLAALSTLHELAFEFRTANPHLYPPIEA